MQRTRTGSFLYPKRDCLQCEPLSQSPRARENIPLPVLQPLTADHSFLPGNVIAILIAHGTKTRPRGTAGKFRSGNLPSDQFPEYTINFHKFAERAPLHNLPSLQNVDAVSLFQRGQPMRDDQPR